MNVKLGKFRVAHPAAAHVRLVGQDEGRRNGVDRHTGALVVIADGRHLPSTILRLVYKLKGVERTCLTTDALAYAANEGKPVDDPRIIIEDGVCKLADHSSLVGSIATMDVLVRTMAQNAGVPLADAVRMASETPARLMGVDDRKGSLQRGKDADIVILDRKLNVRSVWSMGHLVEGTNTLA